MWHDPDDRLQKAIDRYGEGDVGTARRMLRALDKQGVLSPRIDLFLGHCHLDDDQPRAALRRYRRCLAIRSDDVDAWVGVALCQGRLGHLDRAARTLERATRLDRRREEVHCHLVHCYALLGRVADAERHARIATTLDPHCPHVHRHLAVAYVLAGRPRSALAAWRRVFEREPSHAEVDVGMARCYAALGRRSEARAFYRKALEAGAYAADAHAGLGELAWAEGRYEDAAARFRQAVLIDPEQTEARLRLAETLGEIGRLTEAGPHVEALRTLWDPSAPREDGTRAWRGDPEATEVVARLVRLAGHRGRGLRILRRAAGALEGSVDALCRVGSYLLDTRHPALAARVLGRALRRERAGTDAEPGMPARLLARALGRSGRRREAVRVLARAAHRHPRQVELHVDVAATLLARGRPEAAERALLRGLAVLP
ncbi:MAG: tetratricopeptide repeat protein, partial [Planctomycetota bacterium]